MLLEIGVDTDPQDKNRKTPLLWAAGKGHTTIVKMLLEKGADVNARDSDMQTPLSWAAANGYTTTVTALLARGAHPNLTDTKYGQTALSHAAFRGHVETVRVLLSSEADPNLKDHQNRTPLMLAERNRQTIVANMIRTYKPGSSSTNFTTYPTTCSRSDITGQRYREGDHGKSFNIV
jgi:ankyrin repeat protein